MEVKKSHTADLEHRRPARLFMGMLVAVACFVVAMEYSVSEMDGLFDSDFFDEIAEEMEFIPPLQETLPIEEENEVKQSDQLEVVQEVYENEKAEEAEEVPQPELLTEEEVLEENVEDKVESVVAPNGSFPCRNRGRRCAWDIEGKGNEL